MAVIEGAAQDIAGRERVVDTAQVLIGRVFASTKDAIVEKRIRGVVRLRPHAHQFLAHGSHQTFGQDFARDLLPRHGVGQADRIRAERVNRVADISHPFRGGRREGHHGRTATQLPEELRIEKEESLVLPDGTADGSAQLIPQGVGKSLPCAGIEERERVQHLVPVILVQRAVEGIGAGLGDHADDVVPLPITRRKHAGLDPEFLNGIDRGRGNHLVVIRRVLGVVQIEGVVG